MFHAISLAAVLAALWLLLSGHFTDGLLLGLGAVSVLGTVFIAVRMDLLDREGHPIHLSLRALFYWPWLIKEIVLANIDVAKAIVGLSDTLDPTVFTVRSSQRSELGRGIYANSITLTPGTVTAAVEGDELTIHSLTVGSREGLASGEMDRRVTRLEGES